MFNDLHLRHKGLLSKLFDNTFQYTSINIHWYNSSDIHNLCKSRVRTSEGNQSILWMAIDIWKTIRPSSCVCILKTSKMLQSQQEMKLFSFTLNMTLYFILQFISPSFFFVVFCKRSLQENQQVNLALQVEIELTSNFNMN